jgi:hypothetical protein
MNLIGKTLSELSPEELENIVIFLDIDDTLGKAIEIIELDTTNLYECIPGCKLLYVFEDYEPETYIFCYFIKSGIKWKKIKVKFKFRKSVLSVFDFFKKKNIHEIYLLSAAAEEYIEGIHHILQFYYKVNVKGYKSVSNVQQQIILEQINGTYKTVLYMEKDMIKAMNDLNISLEKIPILFDDKPYWAKNGFVVLIEEKDSLETFINTPIQRYREPLFIIYE